jgi:hypothetical protein
LLWDQPNEWLHLKISDTLTNEVWYDSLATVLITEGFKDTVYLDAGTYKCEILDMGAAVSMPIITLENGHVVPWGYPEHKYYLFTVPGSSQVTYSNLDISKCEYYVSPSLRYTWTSSGEYIDTIPNSNGYDSIMTINLTIINLDITVTYTEDALVANESDAAYQWIVCNSGSSIVGANEQSYIPIVDGLYSVQITKGECNVTSDCYSYIVNNIKEQTNSDMVLVYPNPTNGLLNIETSVTYGIIYLELTDISGKSLAKYSFHDHNLIQINFEGFHSGLYYVNIHTDTNIFTFKVIKN